MWVLISLLLALHVLFYVWYYRQRNKYGDLDKLPGPPTRFLTGNATEFGSNIVAIMTFTAGKNRQIDIYATALQNLRLQITKWQLLIFIAVVIVFSFRLPHCTNRPPFPPKI